MQTRKPKQNNVEKNKLREQKREAKERIGSKNKDEGELGKEEDWKAHFHPSLLLSA